MIRRKFLQASAAAATASAFSALSHKASTEAAEMRQAPPLPKRPYGNTGEYLSILGFPGLACNNMDPAVAEVLVRDAIEAGINYFDVAPRYGNAESVLGPVSGSKYDHVKKCKENCLWYQW